MHATPSCMPIVLKLYICFGHGLKRYMWCGYYPPFSKVDLVILGIDYFQSE